jgi:hypothetical protein
MVAQAEHCVNKGCIYTNNQEMAVLEFGNKDPGPEERNLTSPFRQGVVFMGTLASQNEVQTQWV